MLYEEAKWVGERISKHMKSLEAVLNLGSSSLHSRTIVQPQMEEFIFGPLSANQVNVIHSDISKEEGVDLVGDFTDPDFVSELSKTNFDLVICCNLLEHLEERALLINSLESIIPSGGFLIVTVPHIYPYHLDPIDTLYRPSVDGLLKEFSSFELIEGEEVKARRFIANDTGQFQSNYFQMLMANPGLFAKLLFRSLLPFYKYEMWKITVNDLKKMFQRFEVTCVVLRKK